MPTPAPDVGGLPDWLGMAGMGWSLRTPAHGSLHRSGIEATSRFDTRHSPPTNPRTRLAVGHYHYALRLNPAEKVLAPAACGSSRTAIAEAHTAVSVAIGYRLAEPHRHPIGFSLRLPNAQSSLFRNACAGPGGTLSAVNRLVLHSHSLQAQCFAAGASRVVGGVSLSEVLHYAHRTSNASPPFEHSPTSPNHEIKAQAS